MLLGMTPVLQPYRSARSRKARAVAGCENGGIASSAMPIDKDAVAYGEARLACEPIIGRDAGAYHDQIGGDPAGLGVYREPAIGQFGQGRPRGAYPDIGPARAAALGGHRGECDT